MSYYGGNSLSLSVEGYGPGDFSNCHKKVTASISIPAASNTLSFTLTSSTATSADNPKARVILYVRDTSNPDDNTNVIASYDSGYTYDAFPHANTSVSGTLDTRGFAGLRVDLRLYVASSGTLANSTTGYMSRTTYYTVKFHDGYTGVVKTQDVASGGSATPPSLSARTGYRHTGWNSSYTNVNSDRTVTAVWTAYILTVNYYSNYATEAFSEALNEVGPDKNVLVRQTTHAYNANQTDGLWNYSLENASTYLGRRGYKGTGDWGTQLEGGYLVNESTGFTSGQALAVALGKSLANGDASVNVYPQWEPDANVYANIDNIPKMGKCLVEGKHCLVWKNINGAWHQSIV